jgi:hypothetical protein
MYHAGGSGKSIRREMYNGEAYRKSRKNLATGERQQRAVIKKNRFGGSY